MTRSCWYLPRTTTKGTTTSTITQSSSASRVTRRERRHFPFERSLAAEIALSRGRCGKYGFYLRYIPAAQARCPVPGRLSCGLLLRRRLRLLVQRGLCVQSPVVVEGRNVLPGGVCGAVRRVGGYAGIAGAGRASQCDFRAAYRDCVHG